MLSSVEESNMFKILKRLLKKSDVENKSLSDEYLEIVRKFGELGIRIQDITEIPVKIWTEIYNYIDRLYNLYPELPTGFLKLIDLQNAFSIGNTDFCKNEDGTYNTKAGVKISLNKKYLLEENTFIKKIETTKTLLTPADSIKFIIAHEFGHVIDIYKTISEKGYVLSSQVSHEEIFAFFNTINYSDRIVLKVIEENFPDIKKHNYAGFLSEKMGYTASSSFAETFAEAIAFNFVGTDNDIAKLIIEYRNN